MSIYIYTNLPVDVIVRLPLYIYITISSRVLNICLAEQ